MHGHVEYAAHIQIVQVYRSIELFVNFSIFFLFLVHVHTVADKSKWPGPASLETLACRVFAENVPFEAASHYKATKQATLCTPLPEDSQLSIAYLSFPTNEADLRLYSNLSNGSSKEFRRGQALVGQVRNVFQIGMCSGEDSVRFLRSCSVLNRFPAHWPNEQRLQGVHRFRPQEDHLGPMFVRCGRLVSTLGGTVFVQNAQGKEE